MTLFEELKWRGLIKDVSDEDAIREKLDNEKISFYWGTDPTADSLHIGHYSSLLMAKRLAKRGHHPILLVGGATGLIGDPRPTAEREIISKETVENNLKGIASQVESIIPGAEVVNNYDWISKMNFIDFLRDVGKYINVNYMLSKDIISRRLDSGITFAEFSYTLIQGYDFVHLFKEKNCVIQAAGSDQWGNMTTGIELIRKMLNKDAYAFTMPLILDAQGNKFGKSEGNALWLDKNKTSSYELYQYLINTDDVKIEDYLKVYTFLNKEEIDDIMKNHKERPELRLAQKALAKEFITDLHGSEEYEKAVMISEALFGGSVKKLSKEEILLGFKGVPTFEIKEGITLIDMLIDNNICTSKREAREFLNAGSISINDDKVTDENMIITKDQAIDNQILVIRRGKKKNFIAKLV